MRGLDTAEVAAHTGIHEREIGQALRGFAAAGIVARTEATPTTGEPSNRWHPELRYVLDGTTPRAELVDPICGMPVDPDSPHIARDHTGALVRFCSPSCRAAHRARN